MLLINYYSGLAIKSTIKSGLCFIPILWSCNGRSLLLEGGHIPFHSNVISVIGNFC